MSSEKWSGGDEAGKSEGLEVGPKKEKKKDRKLSWQETPTIQGFSRVLSRDEVIKLECTSEDGPPKDPMAHASISDGEVAVQRKMRRRQRGRRPTRGNASSASFRSSHRRVKSLVRFELSDYSMKDIRKIHEEIESRETKPFVAKVSQFSGFTRRQKLVLVCLCMGEFASSCSASIMAPFFPREAKEKGMSEMTSGFVFSFYAFVVFVSSPFFGKILPQVGGKFLFLVGVFMSSNCNLLFGVLHYIRDSSVFAVYCFIVQGFKALGSSAYWTATYVFISDVFPANTGAVLGVMETFVGLGLSVGPAIGGFFYHIGGFGLPFYALGVVLMLVFPAALYLLPSIQGSPIKRKSGSLVNLLVEPSVIVVGLVVVVVSSVWSFMDPTLEPHLRQFELTPEKIGLIFLLLSALYGISSPFWGYVSDKTNNHWFMMTGGMLISTVALLLLGPAPFIPFLPKDLRLCLVALAILGVSVSLTLLPTYQGLLTAVSRGNPGDLSVSSIVAGTWASLYSLGEVIGPLGGGILMENYGFPVCSTVMAGVTFALAVGSFVFYSTKDCLTGSGKHYRYNSDESDGYDSDYSNNSDDINQPLLQPAYQNRLYTEENSL